MPRPRCARDASAASAASAKAQCRGKYRGAVHGGHGGAATAVSNSQWRHQAEKWDEMQKLPKGAGVGNETSGGLGCALREDRHLRYTVAPPAAWGPECFSQRCGVGCWFVWLWGRRATRRRGDAGLRRWARTFPRVSQRLSTKHQQPAEAAASGNGSEKGFEYHCRRADLATAGTLHYHHNLFSDSRQEKAAATSSRRAFPETQIGNESRKRRFGSVFEAGPGRLLLIGFLENVRVEPGHGVVVIVGVTSVVDAPGWPRMAPPAPPSTRS